MNIELTLEETRILGSLMEKSVVTPDQYPLTLNALVNACNQKSSRDPVLSLDRGTVQRTARLLEERHLITRSENFRSGVEKHAQRLCNTPYSEIKLSAPEFAVICLLLLRGPQTPGELRTRSGRLHAFADNQEVTLCLEGLMERDGGALVARLPRRPGRQDSEYAHLFSGHIESARREEAVHVPRAGPAGTTDRFAELENRVLVLERALGELRRDMAGDAD